MVRKPETPGMSKICIVGPSTKFYSGLSACTIYLANALAQHNDVSVILLRKLLPKFLYPGKAHMDRQDYLLDFEPGVAVFDGMDWYSPISWVKAYNFLMKERPDAVIISWWTSSVAHMQLFLLLAGKPRLKAKWILDMHEIVDSLEQGIPLIRIYSRMMSWLELKLSDTLVIHSESVKKQLTKIYHQAGRQASTIPIGLFDSYRGDYDSKVAKNELGIEEDFVILSFGSIRKYKGVPSLVEAFDRLPEPVRKRARLVIAGEDWGDDEKLEDLIKSSAAKDHINFTQQFVADNMIAKYFSAADVVVLPYLRTSGSAVATIAMVHGKPIITSDIAAMRECLTDYAGGTFVAPGDSAAIADRLTDLFNLKEAGRYPVYEAPANTWDYVAGEFTRLINKL
jgi:glycosyltransferase involved in cell wall biosynthesis